MSVDLDWLQLSTLSDRLVDSLNRHLQSTQRPSFLGPITINSFEFGTISPEVELIDVRDIYRDFLEEEENSESDGNSLSEGSDGVKDIQDLHIPRRRAGKEEDGYEWVSRRGVGRAMAETGPGYHPLPPHVRYGGTSPASNPLIPGTSIDIARWQQMGMAEERPSVSRRGSIQQDRFSMDGSTTSRRMRRHSSPKDLPLIDSVMTSMHVPSPEVPLPEAPQPKTVAPPDTENDLQFHLKVEYHSDLRISLTTSLILNYPTPLFMALPINLTIVGFEFNGEVVVAYQPSQKRVHLCILDDEDPYRPASASSPPYQSEDHIHHAANHPYEKDKISAGERLLPQIFIESEIGQADKQVLRNVSRVEKFIQDMMRTTLEDELVFPNFHTIVYGADEEQ